MNSERARMRHEREMAQGAAVRELAVMLVSNPIIELVGGFVLIETLQRYPQSRPIIGSLQGTIMEAAIAQLILVQQLAPSLPYVAKAGGDLLGAVGKLAPLLAA